MYFMTKGKQKTGVILPRNYGLRVSMPASMPDVFVSPTAYVLGQIMLERPSEIRSRITDWSGRNDMDLQEVIEELSTKVTRREGSKNILNFSRRASLTSPHDTVLRDVKNYQQGFTGVVQSKARGSYEFTMPNNFKRRDHPISYPGAYVGTMDKFWNDGKGKNLTVIGTHLAVPEIALRFDTYTGLPQRSNMTGLAPRDRFSEEDIPTLPFRLNCFMDPARMDESQKSRYDLVTDLFMDYYLNGTSQYELSKSALQNDILSQTLKDAFLDPRDRAQFRVLRQKEEETTKGNRDTVSAKVFLEKLNERVQDAPYSYHHVGYMREFAGSEHEIVTKRFEPQGVGPVYSIGILEGVPIVVKRNLEGRAENWMDSENKIESHPFSRGSGYKDVDDNTRRDSYTSVILPDRSFGESFGISQNLQAMYDKVRLEHRNK